MDAGPAGYAWNASATISLDAGSTSGARVLSIVWMITDGNPSSPPNDQFDATVTDATGKVTGQLVKTGQYTWNPPEACGFLGYWNGPELTDDGGVE